MCFKKDTFFSLNISSSYNMYYVAEKLLVIHEICRIYIRFDMKNIHKIWQEHGGEKVFSLIQRRESLHQNGETHVCLSK